MADKEKKILNAMKKAGKPMRPGEVAEVVGLEKDEVSKLIKKMKKEGLLVMPKNCYYEPAGK